MSMSSAGRAENSNGCVTRPKGREIGLSGFAAQIQLYSLTGSYVMATAEHREPYESRGSRTVLGARGGEIPPRDSTFTSLWLLRSTVRMSASHPKATESLRSSEMTLSAGTGREQAQQRRSFFDHLADAALAVNVSIDGRRRRGWRPINPDHPDH